MLEVARVRENRSRVGCARQEAEGGLSQNYGPKAVDSGLSPQVKFDTLRFGELSVAEDKIISFPNGVLGFPDAKRFTILDYEGDVPFKWLQSVDDPTLAFLIVIPDIIKPDYSLSLKGSDIAEVGGCEEGDIAVFAILTIPDEDPKRMTANLRGPLVINSATMKGKQIVLEDDRYAVRHPVFSCSLFQLDIPITWDTHT